MSSQKILHTAPSGVGKEADMACVTSLLDLGQQLWTSASSKGELFLLWFKFLLIWQYFARLAWRLEFRSAQEFSAATLLALLFALLALLSETEIPPLLQAQLQKCAKDYRVALGPIS